MDVLSQVEHLASPMIVSENMSDMGICFMLCCWSKLAAVYMMGHLSVSRQKKLHAKGHSYPAPPRVELVGDGDSICLQKKKKKVQTRPFRTAGLNQWFRRLLTAHAHLPSKAIKPVWLLVNSQQLLSHGNSPAPDRQAC